MKYSQKYCIVSFLGARPIGLEFDMSEWPLHITLADVFAIERSATDIDRKIGKLVSDHHVITTVATERAKLGAADVVLVDKTPALARLHDELVSLLESSGAVFNTPDFIRGGFMPHCTVQKSGELHLGETVDIETLALIDMFHGGDWKRRKVLAIFKLGGK